MFQAERATPTEFRDSHGYDLVGACCALETLLPPAVSALKQFHQAPFPQLTLKQTLSFDSFSAGSLMFHAHCTRNPKVDPGLLWRLPSWTCNFTSKKRLTSIRLKTPLAIRVGDLWSSWLSALSLSLLWKEVLYLALEKMLKCQTTLLFEALALLDLCCFKIRLVYFL